MDSFGAFPFIVIAFFSGGEVMCEYCEKPNKTIVTHLSGVSAFVGANLLWLRFYDEESNKTICNADAINYCPMCGRKLNQTTA